MGEKSNQKNNSHSVKVPRIYKLSAGILAAHLRGEGSVKDLVYNQGTKKRHPRVSAIFALASEAARYENVLTQIFSATKLIENEHPLDPCLAKILAAELIWGKGLSNAGDSRPVATVRTYEAKFKANINGKEVHAKSISKHQIPRYVKINLLKAFDSARVISTLTYDGFAEIVYDQENISYLDFVKMSKDLKINEFMVDYHFKDLLAFGAGTIFFDYNLYNDGILILQDKASCLAVEALNPPQGSFVLDACAAPGMKTLQAFTKISSIDNEIKGEMIAVERDPKRCRTLRSLMQKFGCDEIKILNNDFLELNPNDYSAVEYIILDPSCSGSGIFHRNEVPGKEDSADRIEKLASFQTKLLRHALSFPCVKRVAYSTCSVHKRENEEVVMEILNGNDNNEPVQEFKLMDNCVPSWERRGLSEFGNIAKSFIRSKPIDDLGIGFFVAVFERIVSSGEEIVKKKKRKHITEDSKQKKSKNI